MSAPPPPPPVRKVEVWVQFSSGRYLVTFLETDTLKVARRRVKALPGHSHLNLGLFAFYYDGRYFTDNSQTVGKLGIPQGATLHLVPKRVCPLAQVDTEKKAE
eukprot:Hpha_TRINITY_DN15262_c1_g3::TRINITY_DN15262_c1_g3_i1::g.64268::m.64268